MLCFAKIASEAKEGSSTDCRVPRMGQFTKNCNGFCKILLLELCNFTGFKRNGRRLSRSGQEGVVEQAGTGISINGLRAKNNNQRSPTTLAGKLYRSGVQIRVRQRQNAGELVLAFRELVQQRRCDQIRRVVEPFLAPLAFQGAVLSQ